MSQTTGIASGEAASRFQTSCPYVGMVSDPQTHVGIPDARNYCHLLNPAREVSTSHQQGFCLAQQFPNCEIYKTTGEGEIPEGIFEDGSKSERSFALPFLFARRSQAKASKSATADIKTTPISEPTPQPVSAQTETVTEPMVDPFVKPKPEPVVAAVVATEVISPADEEEELRARLYDEAVSRYEQVNTTKKERKGFWIILSVAAVIVLVISIWGVIVRVQNIRQEAQIQAEIGYTRSLATAVQDMGVAAEAWGTAAGIIEGQEQTATALIFGSATAARANELAQATAQAATSNAQNVTPTTQALVCQNINDAAYQVISGPELFPPLRTLYRPGLTNPQASWIIQNNGVCGWSQILLWSVRDNTISQAVIKRNGAVITPGLDVDQPLIAPGEQIELVLPFTASQAERVEGEWVLVVDGLSLVSQPRLTMDVRNWVMFSQFIQPTSLPPTRKPGGSGSGPTNPTDVPPNRDPTTEVPPPPRP
jgi:hypothetical protein